MARVNLSLRLTFAIVLTFAVLPIARSLGAGAVTQVITLAVVLGFWVLAFGTRQSDVSPGGVRQALRALAGVPPRRG